MYRYEDVEGGSVWIGLRRDSLCHQIGRGGRLKYKKGESEGNATPNAKAIHSYLCAPQRIPGRFKNRAAGGQNQGADPEKRRHMERSPRALRLYAKRIRNDQPEEKGRQRDKTDP